MRCIPQNFFAIKCFYFISILFIAIQLVIPITIFASSQNAFELPNRPELNAYTDPEISVQKIIIEEIRLYEADVITSVVITNPNNSVTITNLVFHVRLNNSESGQGQYKEKITLPANGSISINLPLTVDLSVLPSLGATTILNSLQINYEVDAEFDVSIFLFKKHFKKRLTGKMLITQVIPEITLPRISLPKFLSSEK